MSTLLGVALAATASAQLPTQRIDPGSEKLSGAPAPKGSSSGPSTAGSSQFGGGMIFISTDNCSSPTAISGEGSHPFDTTPATTSGFSGGGSCGAGADTLNQDLFWQWTATTAGDYQFDTLGSSFDTKLSVHSGSGCAAVCVGYNDDSGGTLQSRVQVTGVSSGATFVLQVGGWGGSAGTGILHINRLVPPPNDDCASTIAISGLGSHAFKTLLATTSGFNGGGSCPLGASSINQDIFWQWTATAAGDYQFDTFGSTFDTKLSVHAGVGCAAACVGYNDDSGGLQSMVQISGVNIGDTFLVQVGGFGSNSGSGVLNIDTYIDPCSLPPDPFEPNNSCAQAVPIGDGTYLGLNVSRTDWDFYEVQVADGATLTVDVLHTWSNGDIDSFLYLAGSCQDGHVGTTGALASGYTSSDNEFFTWTNNTGADQTCIIKINIWPSSSQGDCNVYDMIITGASGGPSTEFCPGDAGCPCSNDNDGSLGVAGCGNSSFGSGCRITLGGTHPSATTVVAQNAKPGQFAIVVRGTAFGGGVAVLDGRYCLQGTTARSSAFTINAFGEAVSPVLPQGPAGVEWYYQVWYRDNDLCSGSNFSNGLAITW